MKPNRKVALPPRADRCGRRALALMAGFAAVLLLLPAGAVAATVTFSTPGSHSLVIPAGITSISFDVFGARGGDSGRGKAGGLGAEARASSLAVTPGETLTVIVGGRGGKGTAGSSIEGCASGAGGTNGGGAGGACSPLSAEQSSAGGGGGASQIDRGATTLVVAGGGGGAGGNGSAGTGGAGGQSGVNGGDDTTGSGGKGGGGATPTAPGLGGAGQGSGTAGGEGSAGQGGGGGAYDDAPGGGGGGGAFGGGGGGASQNFAGGGGGGGSSTGPAGTAFTTGVDAANSGDGKVVVSFGKASPPLTVAASAGVMIGGQVDDTATLSGGLSPSGQITFDLYGPDDSTCAGPPVFTDAKSVSGNGSYQSSDFTPTAAGTYRWTAEYSGDADNEAVTSGCNAANQSVSVSKATPTISTTASGTVVVGGEVSDEATVSGRVNPQAGAHIRFELYGPNDESCTGPPLYVHEVGYAPSDTTVSSGSTPATRPGTYRWTAEYTGDADNEAVLEGCNGANESVTVGFATPTLSGQASPGVTVGEPVHDSATLTGGFVAFGTITFALFAPGDITCAGPPVMESTVPVSGDGSYESASGTLTPGGEYRWTAEYSGDTRNGPASTTCGEPEQSVVIAKAASTSVLAATPNPAAAGAKVTLTAIVTGHQPGGTVTFMDGSTVLGASPVDASGHATLDVVDLAPGIHALSAQYSGDGANLAGASPTVSETVEAAPTPKPEPPLSAPKPESSIPVVTLTYSPNHPHTPNPKGGARYTFHFSAPGGGLVFQCRLDGNPWRACGSPTVYRGLKPGNHVFRVKAIDSAGRESAVETVKFVAGRRSR